MATTKFNARNGLSVGAGAAPTDLYDSNGTYVPRVVSYADATSVTLNCATTDVATMSNTQASGTFTLNAPTGTPYNGQKLIFRLTTTNAQTFSWDTAFLGSTDLALPTSSSGGSKEDYLGFIYDSVATKWHLIAKSFGY